MVGHAGIYATLIQYQAKCGANVSAATAVEAWANQVINEAEGLINGLCRKEFAVDATAFAALPAAARMLLTEVTTDIAAIYAIQYDMSGFSSRAEAETMILTLRDAAMRGLGILRDKKTQEFLLKG